VININHPPVLLVIAGPTGSGKSRVALDLATKLSCEIINADAIQVYKSIPILSCSPNESDILITKHHLYNYVPITEHYSVMNFIQAAKQHICDITQRGIVPILVGGTGMYIKSLCEGINTIPDINIEIRDNARKKYFIDPHAFYEELKALDPLVASKLHKSNTNRIIRAYEVYKQTGRSIYEFHANAPMSFLDGYKIVTIVLAPEREFLYFTCDKRFIEMIQHGAIDEVASVNLQYQCANAATKAIGFKEISLYLENKISYEECIELSQINTRHYAKRQVTWFKHQIRDAHRIEFDKSNIDSVSKEALAIIEQYV
jgi:tRNA dimethylallyltransferase